MHSLFICLISISDFFFFLAMKMSHKRKILLFKSCLPVTYQPFVFYTYIFLIHKIHHKISTARNPDKHQPVVCEQDNLTDRGFSWETALATASSDTGRSAAALAVLSAPRQPASPTCPGSRTAGDNERRGQRGGGRGGSRSDFDTPQLALAKAAPFGHGACSRPRAGRGEPVPGQLAVGHSAARQTPAPIQTAGGRACPGLQHAAPLETAYTTLRVLSKRFSR